MREILSDLMRALEEETGLQRQLLDLGQEKRGALVAVDTARVDTVTRREQTVLVAVGAAGSRRMRLTVELGNALRLPPNSGIPDIARSLEEPRASALREAGEALKTTLKNIARVTRSCEILASESLGFVRSFFQIVTSAGVSELGYTPRGAAAVQTPNRLLIDEVV